MKKTNSPFWVIVRKEIADTIRSWKFIIMVAIIILTCCGALYSSLANFASAIKEDGANDFFFLKLFTISNGTLPSFYIFISFLGPLLGISMGFDAINSEQNNGTMSRILAQPIYRDYIINAKFTASLIILSVLFIVLNLLVIGFGLIFIGIPPTSSEFFRIVSFTLITIVYIAFWLNLSILFSVIFKQTATSALAGIAVWIFFSIFYVMIIKLIASGLEPKGYMSQGRMFQIQYFLQNLLRINPEQLFNDASVTLLIPSVRSLGVLTPSQTIGAIPNPLPLGQSWMIIWPQITALISGTVLFFALAYNSFMRREIRSRN